MRRAAARLPGEDERLRARPPRPAPRAGRAHATRSCARPGFDADEVAALRAAGRRRLSAPDLRRCLQCRLPARRGRLDDAHPPHRRHPAGAQHPAGRAASRRSTSRRCWRAPGIAPALLESPLARVSQRQYALLIRALRRELRDELWGLLATAAAARQLRPVHAAAGALRARWARPCATASPSTTCCWTTSCRACRCSERHGARAVRAAARRRCAAGLCDQGLHAVRLRRRLLAGGAPHPAAGGRLHRRADSTDTSRVYQVPIRYGPAARGPVVRGALAGAAGGADRRRACANSSPARPPT